MKILLCMEDPRIPTGYGKICRQASENLTKRGHTVYSLAFNNTAPNLSVVNFQWGTVLPNISLSKNKELLFGDKDIIENAFKEFSIDSIIFCNDTHRFAYIKELPKNILSQSWFWHVCEADTYDWLGIDIFNRIKGVVFATKFTENYNKEHVKSQIYQIYPSVDINVFKPLNKNDCRKELKIPDNIFTILRVDRAQPRKKWELTLRAFSLFKRNVQDAMLYCKCDPHDQASPYNLVEMAESLGIASHVRFDSRIIDDNELAKIYNAADVSFSTTSGEGYGFFQAESMACGIPQIVTNASVCPEICGDTARFLRIEKKEVNSKSNSEHNIIDVKDAEKALEKLYQDWKSGKVILNQMSKKAVQRAKEYFNPEQIWNQWNAILIKSYAETDIWTKSKTNINSEEIKLYKTDKEFPEYARYVLFAPDNINVAEWTSNAIKIIKNKPNIGAVCSRKLNIPGLEDFELGDFTIALARTDAIKKFNNTQEDYFDVSMNMIHDNWDIEFLPYDNVQLPQPKMENIEKISQLKTQYGRDKRNNIKIVFHTEINRGIGFSTISESLAPALEKLGFDVAINDWNNTTQSFDDVMSLIKKARNKYQENPDWDDNAINIVCHLMETYDRVRKPYRVGFSFCESTKVRESYLTICNSMNRILTFSDFCKKIQELSGFQSPISVIPPGIRNEYFVNKKDNNIFTFLHVGVAQERKRTQLLVETFKETFPTEQDVQLIVKSNDFGGLDWIKLYKDDRIKCIYTNANPLSIEGLSNLYAKAHCYVQPSSGEGIGLPIFEAMAAALPVIYTDWSAPIEYFNNDIAYPLNIEKMVPAYTGAPQAYPGDNGEWALPDKQHLKKLLKHVYTFKEEAKNKGLKAQKFIRENFTWEKSAKKMLPLIYKMEEERKQQKISSAFNPKSFVKPELPLIKQDDRIEIDIATSDRQDYLAALLISLKTQTFQNWDITLIVDDTDESILQNKLIIGILNNLGYSGHRWRVIKGVRQGPHVSHQKTLSISDHELICRIDDDIIVEPNFLRSLFNIFLADRNKEVSAVGGVFLDPFHTLEEQTFHPDCLRLDAFQGKITDRLMNLQIFNHPNNQLKGSEHLYSSFLYRKSCANAIGGYFLGYSRIGHREETDLTHRMYLAGWKLIVCPDAIGYHFSAPKGGIRIENGAEFASYDEKIFQKRLEEWNKLQ